MNRCRCLIIVLTLLFGSLLAPAPARAQGTGTVSGRVLDSASQQPIVGARVALALANRGAVTGDDGSYLLTGIPEGTQRVRASKIGFAAQERVVNVVAGQPAIADFRLRQSAVKLEEVVTVGYGTQKREDLTGAIASVPAAELQKTAITSVQQGLQGRVAGVVVTNADPAPGGGITVQIRGITSTTGDNQPLYVIDGVPIGSSGVSKFTLGGSEPSFTTMTTTNPLSTLAPSDIESIEILKDASATAIYGSRGANGVVIITTKKGRAGQPGQVAMNFSTGFADVVREVDVLTAPEFAAYVNRAFHNGGNADSTLPYGGSARRGSISPDSIGKRYGNGINWQDKIFHKAVTRDLQMTFSGGDNDGGYAVTGNYLDQGGAIIGSGFKRGGLRMNIDRTLNPIFRLSSNVAVTRSGSDLVRTSGTEGTTASGIVRSAIRYSPIPFEAFDSLKTAVDPRAENPLLFRQFGANPERYTDEVNESETLTRGVGGLRVTGNVWRGFSLETSVGGNYERKGVSSYFPRTVYEGNANGGLAIESNSDYVNIVNDNLVRYQGDVGSLHHIDAVGGFTYQYDKYSWLRNQVASFADDLLGGNVLQNGIAASIPQSGLGASTLASWLGRVNYNFADRYLVTGTVRSDGSSKFAANNKWATFSSLGLGWKAKQESFLRDINSISDLKVRLSYGQSGNQAIDVYQSLATIQGTTTVIGEQLVQGVYFGRLANPDLKWETTTQKDLGIDLGTYGNRVTVTADVYDKRTTGLLQSVTLAPSTGYPSATFNSGEVSNKGYEFQMDYQALTGANSGGLSWTISGNVAHNVNKILNLGAIEQQFGDRLGAGGGLEVNPFIQKPGYAIGTIWGYRTAGIFRDSASAAAYRTVQADAKMGDYKYADINGDGKLTDADRTKIGDANPKYTYGITNHFSWRRFDLSALIQGVQGNSIINSNRLAYLSLNGSSGNVPKEYVKNAFDPVTNPNGKYPMLNSLRSGSGRFSDAFVEDGSYIRLKNLQVGYEIPISVVRGAQSARIYLNAVNLLTSTKYTGYDPEVSAFSNTSMRGVDLGSYPQSRTYSLGLNLTF
jgi:TonB-linked SusC/RagA family outer membrane protein